MSKKARNATIFGIVAGVVLVPILRAAISKYSRMKQAPAIKGAPPNNLFSAYRGKFRPHRRKATQENSVH